MANVVQLQTNFTAGEISPRLFGRADLAKYNNGAKTIENALVEPHGGLTRRPGTKYVDSIKSATHIPRLTEFHFNTEQSYVLEVGVDTADGKPGDTTADTASSYYGATAPGGGSYGVGSPDAHGYIRVFRLDASGDPVRVNIEIQALPWVDIELAKLNFVQSADTLFIFCPTRPVLKLQRTGVDTTVGNWVATPMDGVDNGFIDGPYQDTNTDDIYMTPAATDVGTTTIDASTSEGNPVYHFTQKDIHRVIRLEDPVKGYKIISFQKSISATSTNGALVKVSGRALYDAAVASGSAGTGIKVEFFETVRGPVF